MFSFELPITVENIVGIQLPESTLLYEKAKKRFIPEVLLEKHTLSLAICPFTLSVHQKQVHYEISLEDPGFFVKGTSIGHDTINVSMSHMYKGKSSHYETSMNLSISKPSLL